MGIRIGIGGLKIGQGSTGVNWSSYWTTRGSLQYSALSGLDLLETFSGSNLNAKVLPASYIGAGTGYYLIGAQNLGKSHTIKFNAVVSGGYVCSHSLTTGGTGSWITLAENVIAYRVGGVTRSIPVTMDTGYHEIVLVRNEQLINITIDGVAQPQHDLTVTYNVDWYLTNIGKVATLYTSNIISYFAFNDHEYVLTGDSTVYDIGSNATKLNILLTLGSAANKTYSIYGSRLPITRGSSIYNKPVKVANLYVPYSASGPATITAPADYVKVKDSPYYAGKLNDIDAIIDFDYADVGEASKASLDRSSATVFEDAARLGYYDAANHYRWHISELNRETLTSFYKTGYKWLFYPHFESNSVETRLYVDELLLCAVDQSVSDRNRVLTYTGDYGWITLSDMGESYVMENESFYYRVIDDSVVGQSGDYMLKQDGTTLTLSTDGGATYPITKTIAGLETIQFFYVWANGNISFADRGKMYVSTNNLSIVTEVVPKDTDGSDFAAFPGENYWVVTNSVPTFIGGNEIKVLANYGNFFPSVGRYNETNVWYSVNNGTSWKSAYKFGEYTWGGFTSGDALNAQSVRHGHGCSHNPSDNSFWVTTGDGTDECIILRGTYNFGTDTWSWAKTYGDNDGGSSTYTNATWYKFSGLEFHNGDIYWGGDSATPARKGIFKCAEADFANTANYVKVGGLGGQAGLTFMNGDQLLGFEAESSAMVYRIIITSNGLIKFDTRQLNVGLTGDAIFLVANGKTTTGWYSILVQEYPYTVANMLTGKTLMIKLK